MDKLTILTIVGTRPELIRLSRVINKLDLYFNHIIAHTGQNYDYELNQIFFENLEIRKPDVFFNVAADTPGKTIGNILIETDKFLINKKIDALLILGDTNSCLCSIIAKRRKIPIFHMEAGNRCFDLRVPEEINRKIVDHIADINLTYSSISKEYLIKEGLSPEKIICVGSPMKEVINYYLPKILDSKILNNLSLTKNKYFLFSCHREENLDNEENLFKLFDVIDNLSEIYKLPIIFSVHPRTKLKIEQYKKTFSPLVKLLKPLGFFDYIKLQIDSKVVLSDSGTITEESSILNFPALNIRNTHERPEGMEESSVMLVGMNIQRIMQALNILEDQKRGDMRTLKLVEDYSSDNVSEKIVRIILSYVDYTNIYNWKKSL